MPGSVPSMAVQKSAIPQARGPLSTYTIKTQRKGNSHGRMEDNIKPNSQAKKTACTVHKHVQIYNSAFPRANSAANGGNVEERLKAARERREEQQKLLASREKNRLEREQRARQYYEQQLQERKKKLQNQRFKEEKKRSAVEEKRKQKLKEEKERYESAVRKTLEKSQRAQQNQNSRGRNLAKNIPRHSPLATWEKNLVSRLLTPTCSYLARSKSAGCQSGQEDSFHSMNTTTVITPPKPQHHPGSVQKRPPTSPGRNNSQHRSVSVTQARQAVPVASHKTKPAKPRDTNKKNSNSGSTPKPPAANMRVKPVAKSRTGSPSPDRTPPRSVSRHSTPLQIELPSVPEEDVSSSSLSSGHPRPIRTSAEGLHEKIRIENPPETSRSHIPDNQTEVATKTIADKSPARTPAPSPSQPPEVMSRPSAGTTDREEASRIMAEKRREARLQREREEQERLQREEAERRCREELERKRVEERARQQAEAQRLIEEKRRREEEEQRRAEEERAQAMREAALLQKQREEEQAKENAKTEQLRKERELLAQKEEAARQARKKRLEEIMRRTRRTDSPDTKSVPAKNLPNEAQPKENTEPANNGVVEDVIKTPVGTKTSQMPLTNEEDMVPVVAFKERKSLRTLTGLEEIQTHQRAEVI